MLCSVTKPAKAGEAVSWNPNCHGSGASLNIKIKLFIIRIYLIFYLLFLNFIKFYK